MSGLVLRSSMPAVQSLTWQGSCTDASIDQDHVSSGLALSGPLRLRVQSRSRTRLRIAASIAFLLGACFTGV